jgi:hypothetical protein
MTSDIRSILTRLTALEEAKISPAAPKIKGLNPQQKSVDQLPALFKPKDISPVVGRRTDPAHPMKGKLVGANESQLAEMMQTVEEDMLGKVKRDFIDYLERLEDQVRTDPDLKDKAKQEIKQELEAAEEQAVEPAEEQPEISALPVMERPIKTCTMEDGAVLEIYGDEGRGFDVRHQGRILPTRFDRLDDADIAVKLFQKRRAARNANPDYIDEA